MRLQRIFNLLRESAFLYFIYIFVARIGEVPTGFWLGNLRKRDHLEDLGVDASIILKCIFKKWNGGMDWIKLAQDRESCRALVNAAMNLRVP
jgi:hypothetical protein